MKLIKAIADYDDPDPDFAGLSFKKGDLIFLKDTVDENWAEGFNISEEGKLFPLNFTEEIERKKVKKGGSRPQGTRVESQMIRTLPQKKKHKSKSKSKKSKNYKKITKRKKKIKRKTHMK